MTPKAQGKSSGAPVLVLGSFWPKHWDSLGFSQ